MQIWHMSCGDCGQANLLGATKKPTSCLDCGSSVEANRHYCPECTDQSTRLEDQTDGLKVKCDSCGFTKTL